MGWADCKTGASPPSTVSGLSLPSMQLSRTPGKDGHPIPFLGYSQQPVWAVAAAAYCFLPWLSNCYLVTV